MLKIKSVFNYNKRRNDLLKTLVCTIPFILLLLMFPSRVNSQVVINELGVKSSPDWIEIYNYELQPVNLDDYKLKDESGNELILTGMVESEDFAVFEWSNRLNNDGDSVTLVRILESDEEVVEEVVYGDRGGVCVPGDATGSIGKADDGGNTIVRFSVASEGVGNDQGTLLACPTPTPDPTRTPTSAPAPAVSNVTATSTIRSTPKLTPKPTVTPKKTLKPTPTETPDDEDEVLGASEEEESPTPTPEEDSENSNKPFPVIPVLLIVAGAGLIIGAIVYYLKTTGFSFKIRKGGKDTKARNQN